MATMFPNIPTAQTYRAPGPYDEDYRSIARREQLAQILQQQALQPIEAGSYQGIQAPISPLSGIAKVLQGYFAGQQMDSADQARQDLALKAQNADLALSNLPPIEAKPKQLAQPYLAKVQRLHRHSNQQKLLFKQCQLVRQARLKRHKQDK